jgi:sporadic carbohydrate cluster 2OG-Fe(II) oxygenase
MSSSFQRPEEEALGRRFIDDGYVVAPADDRAALDRIRAGVAALAAKHLGVPEPKDPGTFLDGIHETVDDARLNALRLAVIQGINLDSSFRPAYFALARNTIEAVVGNELCMQRRVNLSIQLPNDESSLLPLHTDVWSGDSPFEVVLWVPLVDVYRTKSMYLVPPGLNETVRHRMATARDPDTLFQSIESDVIWIDARYGNVLLFNQNLAHGNRVNREPATRWSMNCRFKSVLSPYADKKLGEFFEPITLRAATRIGMLQTLPGAPNE